MKLHPLLSILTIAAPALHAQEPLPAYTPQQQVSGIVRTWGSPQMSDLLKRYEEGFHKIQPSVRFDYDLKSTLTAVAGVYTGRADIGLLGREIWPTETQAFASIAGHPPLVLDVATGSLDVPKATFALMVFVPRANPLASLSTAQLERLFSNTADHPLRTWGDLGLGGAWAARPVHLYGFSVDNDKSQIFAQLVFKPGNARPARWSPALHESVNTLTTDAGELIVRAVAADPDAIGISNTHYATAAVRALALSTPEHPTPIEPSRANVESRLYPLTRAVYFVLDADAAHPPSPATYEFLRFVLSREGQLAVSQEGNYLPLPSAVALRQLHLLDELPH